MLGCDMTIDEFAELMEVHPRTVRNWLRNGIVPGAKQKPVATMQMAWDIPKRAVAMCKPAKGQPMKIQIRKGSK